MIEPTIYRTRGEHANHYTTDAGCFWLMLPREYTLSQYDSGPPLTACKILVILIDSSVVEQVEEPGIYLFKYWFFWNFAIQYKVDNSQFFFIYRKTQSWHEWLVICQNVFFVKISIFVRFTRVLVNIKFFILLVWRYTTITHFITYLPNLISCVFF